MCVLKFNSCGMSLRVDGYVVTNNSDESTTPILMVRHSRQQLHTEDGNIMRLAASLTLYHMAQCNMPEELTLHTRVVGNSHPAMYGSVCLRHITKRH